MYYPIGWPKIIDVVGLNDATIRQICCDRVKILFAILTDDSLAIYYTNVNYFTRRVCVWQRTESSLACFYQRHCDIKIIINSVRSFRLLQPCVPIVITRRTPDSIVKHGTNCFVEWKPDSNMLVVAVSESLVAVHILELETLTFSCSLFQTSDGTLLLYMLSVVDTPKGIYNQIDPPSKNLCRDSAELFLKETIPSLALNLHLELPLYVPVTSICCVNMHQMMVATKSERILRIRWDGVEDRDFSLDLKRIPFSINQQVSYGKCLNYKHVVQSWQRMRSTATDWKTISKRESFHWPL